MDAIHEAVALGSRAALQTSMIVTLRLTSNRHVRLVGADGAEYYALRGERPPTIFPYEQPLHMEKYVKGFDGKWHQMRRWVNAQPGVPGHWATTVKGAAYFKHNHDEWRVQYPVREAFKEKREQLGYFVQPSTGKYLTVENTLDHPNTVEVDPDRADQLTDTFTVGKLRPGHSLNRSGSYRS